MNEWIVQFAALLKFRKSISVLKCSIVTGIVGSIFVHFDLLNECNLFYIKRHRYSRIGIN